MTIPSLEQIEQRGEPPKRGSGGIRVETVRRGDSSTRWENRPRFCCLIFAPSAIDLPSVFGEADPPSRKHFIEALKKQRAPPEKAIPRRPALGLSVSQPKPIGSKLRVDQAARFSESMSVSKLHSLV